MSLTDNKKKKENRRGLYNLNIQPAENFTGTLSLMPELFFRTSYSLMNQKKKIYCMSKSRGDLKMKVSKYF